MTTIEERLTRLFSSILLIDEVNRDTDFFATGDSVKALRLVAEAENVVGAPLPMWALYKYKTVGGLETYFTTEAAPSGDAAAAQAASEDFDTGVI